jgi:hypothetical protein
MATTKKPITRTKKSVATETVEAASSSFKLPVNFSQFRKYPIAAVAFLCIFGMVYLYKDKQTTDIKGLDNCIENNKSLEKKIDTKDSVILNLITQQAIINATK